MKMKSAFFTLLALILAALLAIGCDSSAISGDGEKDDGSSAASDDGNTDAADETLSDPVISPASGEVTALTDISISCATTGAAIYYTVDGTDPGPASKLYDDTAKPRVYGDMIIRAISVKGDKISKTVEASYIATPYLKDFAVKLEPGMRWNYRYTYRHTVSYSYFGDKSYTTTADFSVIIGDGAEINGTTAYKVITLGSAAATHVKWQFLAVKKGKLLGSKNGSDFVVLFDAMCGFWAGECFFTDFNGAANAELNQVSASCTGDTATVSSGWREEDNDSAYYPETGTIYDPDAWSMYSSKSESYLSGVGPSGYSDSSGYADYYEASSDTYKVELISHSIGEPYADYSYDAVITTDQIVTRNMVKAAERIKVTNTSSSKFVVYVEFTTAGYDPVISVQDCDYKYLVTSQDKTTLTASPEKGMIEIYKSDSIGEGFFVGVSDAKGGTAGSYRIAALQIKAAKDNSAVSAWTPNTINTVPNDTFYTLSLKKDALYCFSAGFSTNTKYYFFIIPKSDTLDMAAVTYVNKDSKYYYLNRVSSTGYGAPEAFYDTFSSGGGVFQLYDIVGLEGDIVFGMGTY